MVINIEIVVIVMDIVVEEIAMEVGMGHMEIDTDQEVDTVDITMEVDMDVSKKFLKMIL